jgi:hypothetical protein
MSQLIVDKSDPAMAEMVAGWEDGGVYRIEIANATQVGTKGNLVTFNVNEVSDYGDAEPAAESEETPLPEEGGDVAGAKPLDKVPIAGPVEV